MHGHSSTVTFMDLRLQYHYLFSNAYSIPFIIFIVAGRKNKFAVLDALQFGISTCLFAKQLFPQLMFLGGAQRVTKLDSRKRSKCGSVIIISAPVASPMPVTAVLAAQHTVIG